MSTVKTIDTFTLAYIECALWSSTDESDEQGGEPLDKNYSIADIAQETLEAMVADCAQFQGENAADIENGSLRIRHECTDRGMAGHDFWLTRNGHGCGFWDGDWPEPQATILTNAAHAFGEYNLYVGDDGLIYGS